MAETTTISPFVHLHTHTEYSLLDGASTIGDVVSKAKACGFPAAAITDHGMMYGVYSFYKECQQQGLKPILGCEVYCAPRSRHKKEGKEDMANYHLILLVKNQTGYRNLIKMVSLGSIEGFYNRPRIDWELLEQHHEGLICLSACVAGQVPEMLLQKRYADAQAVAQRFQKLFGEDYYIEVQDHGLPEEKEALPGLRQIARELNIPIVATNDSHYTNSDDAPIQDALMCISTGKILSDTNRLSLCDQLFYKSFAEMQQVFPENPEYLENSLRIAEKIDHASVKQIFAKKNYVPKFPVPDGYDEASYLKKLVTSGIQERYGTAISEEIQQRYEFELSVITKMGFCGYFLIVSDFIKWAKQNGIAVGPGRGSAAGSIVSYALDITTLDPLKYNLLFERFLNPDRVSMPDIDIDFCIRRRGEVLEYVRQKYGADNVAQIITFGKMAARAVIRDVGRVMNIPLPEVDKLAKMIPFGPDMTIRKALEENPELKALYDNNPPIREHLTKAMKLEGLPKSTGMHAAGVVISAVPLMDIIPLGKDKDGVILTQYAKKAIEEIGLLKMDFLGLRNLTMLEDCLDYIQRNYNVRPDLAKLNFDDQRAYELYRLGETAGIFQCESRGMQSMIRKIQPSHFEDIIAILALYRPGPLDSGMVDQFIERKHGRGKITYAFPELEPYLKDTYGLIIYQEQVMQISTVIGGFTKGEADTLRKAMGSKQTEMMQEMREKFIQGAAAKNFDVKKATELYDLCLEFGKYGFNKSHSAAYAVISYWTAWLKANYRLEFMAALLSSVSGDEDKIIEYINECTRTGINVLPPAVNESNLDFTPINGTIRFGLGAIKNFGANIAEAIVKERAANGVYVSFTDLCSRLDTKQLNKKSIEALVLSGALDTFGRRRAIFEGYSSIIDKVLRQKKELASGQESLFGSLNFDALKTSEDRWPEAPEYLPQEKLRMEKDMLGIFVSDHPLKHIGNLDDIRTMTLPEVREKPLDTDVKLVGIIKKVRRILTKTNKYMAVGELEDLEGSIAIICYPRDYEKCRAYLENDMIALLSGQIKNDLRSDGRIIAVSEVQPLNMADKKQTFYIDLEAVENPNTLEELKNVIKTFRGGTPVILHTVKADISLDTDLWITPNPELKKQVDTLIGSGRSWMA